MSRSRQLQHGCLWTRLNSSGSFQLCLLFANEHGDIVKLRRRVTKNIKVADEQHYRKWYLTGVENGLLRMQVMV